MDLLPFPDISFIKTTGSFIIDIAQNNPPLLFLFFFLFVMIAYKTFQIFFKAFIIGVISAAFPIIANLLGFSIPLTIESLISFGMLGALSYIVYSLSLIHI